MGNYNDWYEKNKQTPLIRASDSIFDNLFLLPQSESRLFGWIRFFGFLSLMWFDPFGLNLSDTFWIIPYAFICLIEMGIGVVQICGYHWGIKETENDYVIRETPSVASQRTTSTANYPNIERWFATRDYYMSGLSGEEQARFFTETGALTDESIIEMSKYPNTRRALERLDYELSGRTPKEQVDFLRGYKS